MNAAVAWWREGTRVECVCRSRWLDRHEEERLGEDGCGSLNVLSPRVSDTCILGPQVMLLFGRFGRCCFSRGSTSLEAGLGV